MLLSQEYRENWSVFSKITFRFVFLYFGLYIFFLFTGRMFFEDFFAWVGKNILKSEGRLEYFPTGSGDTTMAYISIFVQVIFTIIGTFLWSILDRKRKSYNTSFYWLLVLIRIALVVFMLAYGFAKVYKTQFPSPNLSQLLEPLGKHSPMALAWIYMGHSEGFNFFTGLLEVLCGILLIPRRTQTLGSILTMMVMFQIVLLNLFYDIPVKQFAIHLFLMASLIFFTDIKRVWTVFVKNKSVEDYNFFHPVKSRGYHKFIFWFKLIVTVLFVSTMAYQGSQTEKTFGDDREKSELYGIWEVHEFTKNSVERPAIVTDTLRWRYLIFDQKGVACIRTMDNKATWYNAEYDELKKELAIFKRSDSIDHKPFQISKTANELSLKGVFKKDTLSLELKAVDLKKFPLINRPFRWIQETPN
ncbi:hypothetical protein [Tenacibaculum sp. 190524A05c]|uniref:DoxX family protein n=1 Tax=Tenacibaculum platacis TaxID=3137852 RepID=UPI0031FB7EBF